MIDSNGSEFPHNKILADYLEEREQRLGYSLLVTADAVVGGGFDLRLGQRLNLSEVGDYANVLLHSGACELVSNLNSGPIDLI